MSQERETHTHEQKVGIPKRPPRWKRLWGWTGFGEKKLWDWLQLFSALAIPIVLAAAGFWFTAQQNVRQQQIEDQRAEVERELAERRAQDEALQAYLDQMSTLLIQEDLRTSDEGSEVRTLARARTLTILGRVRDLEVIPGQVAQAHVRPKGTVIRGRVGSYRKRAIVQFLYEAALIQKDQPVISLQGADLSGAYLNLATLVEADLHHTILVGADLSAARLNGAYLRWANLLGADLRHAVLDGADLRGAALNGAYLAAATLSNADLRGATLSNADLRYTDLYEADLSGAWLDNANLSEAEGFTNEKLEQQAASLEGATMPNGQNYEDWLKSKGRGQDGENSGSS